MRFALGLFASVGLGFVAANSAQGAPPTCTAEVFTKTKSCQDVSDKPIDLRRFKEEANGVLFNYTYLRSSHANERRKLADSVTEDDRKRALKAANDARDSAIAVVTGGRPRNEWSKEVRALVLRLETVAFDFGDRNSRRCFLESAVDIPNASYRRHGHVVTFCGSLPKLSVEQIVLSVSHELGHVISPCSMQMPLVKIEDQNESEGACTKAEISQLEADGLSYGQDQRTETNDYTVEWNDDSSPDAGCGSNRVLPESDLQNPPMYRPFRDCIETKNQNDYEAYLNLETTGEPNPPKQVLKLKQDQLNQFRKNNPAVCYSKNEEHFADSFSGLTYAAWAKKENLSVAHFKSGLHVYSSAYCIEKLTGEPFSNPLNYPPPNDRISLYLKPAGVSDFLGCTPRKEPLCALADDTFTATMATPPKAQKTKTRGTAP